MNQPTPIPIRPGRILSQTTLIVPGRRENALKAIPGPIRAILGAIWDVYRVSEDQILSRDRRERIAWPRQVAMAIATELGEYTLVEVGNAFQRDHGTVLWAKEQVYGRGMTDKRTATELSAVRKMVKARML